MRYLISISYDGSKFNGFQRLKDNNSVQRVIEDALTKINKGSVVIKGAGRTDRGVHALDQKAHFDLDINITEEGLKKAINSLVKPYIYIKDCVQVNDDFHARFNVTEKKYVYKINNGQYNPILSDYVYYEKNKLDIELMKEASKEFLGVHNFKNFVSGERENYEAIIYDISFSEVNGIIEIEFTGKSFYRYMVRNLVGALIEVGKGKIDKEYIKDMLDNYNKKRVLPTAFARGLYLKNIKY
ncbi:MAG: tRNA pseudouridine(38-40) synthase TruA [Firmicutes bacterium]|nr:tRNA pseudouridine(38-40) synthase TruA [Bacillota bacterium]